LSTALALRGRLRLAEQRATGIAAAFSRLAAAVILVDAAGDRSKSMRTRPRWSPLVRGFGAGSG